MKTHIEVVGIINIASGALGMLAGAFIMTLLIALAPFVDDPIGSTAMVLIAVFCGGAILLLSAPSIISGIGLLKGWSYARLLTIVVAVFALFQAPIGTLIGIYTLWVMTNAESIKLLDTTH